MSKLYMISKSADETCRDTKVNNKLKSIFTMIGIFDDYNSKQINPPTFKDYYTEKINKHNNNGTLKFIGEYHFLNVGIRIIKAQAIKSKKRTSCHRIRKLCSTTSSKPVCIPWNSDDILEVLFEYIYNNNVLREVFAKEIIKDCALYSVEIENYPLDCTKSIIGFLYIFLYNIQDPELNYTQKYNDKSHEILGRMSDTIKKFNLKKVCGRRNN